MWSAAIVVGQEFKLSLFIYAPVQHHDFVAWDDPEYFAENPMVTAGLTWSGFQ